MDRVLTTSDRGTDLFIYIVTHDLIFDKLTLILYLNKFFFVFNDLRINSLLNLNLNIGKKGFAFAIHQGLRVREKGITEFEYL